MIEGRPGVGPAESTGKSGVIYCPGGTRSAASGWRLLPVKPREIKLLAMLPLSLNNYAVI